MAPETCFITQGEIYEWYYAQTYSDRIAALIIALSLDDAFHSWWFAPITAFLCVNLLMCSVLRFPQIRRNWLGFHVSTAIIAYGAFGVSFVLAVIFLLRDRMTEGGFLDQHIPDREMLDMIGYRSISLGLLFLTFTILTGAIWAERAWGSYWSWDPKETWSLVTWIIYAIYLHLRIRRGYEGRTAAFFAAFGFICVLFTYIGVNTFLPGVHSYA